MGYFLLALMFVSSSFLIGWFVGTATTAKIIHSEAIERGFASYQLDKDRNIVFTWKKET